MHQRPALEARTHRDTSSTRVVSEARIANAGGDPWTIEWSTQMQYDGLGVAFVDDELDDAQFNLQRFHLSRQFGEIGHVRTGLSLPGKLSGIDTVDGVQGELSLGKLLRLGATAGMTSVRDGWDFTSEKSLGAVYVSAELGKRKTLYYEGTLAVLGTVYQGEPDQFALLMKQGIDIGPKLSLYSDSVLNTDFIRPESRGGVQLTKLNLRSSSPVTSFLTMRAGFDHCKRPDTRMERELSMSADARDFECGTWRYWVGGSQRMPWNLQLDGELALLDAVETEDYSESWRVCLSRMGLPALPQARVATTVSNLDGSGTRGYRSSLRACVPLFDRKLSIKPALNFQFLEADGISTDFRIMDLSVHAGWQHDERLSFHAGFFYAFGDTAERSLLTIGLQCYW